MATQAPDASGGLGSFAADLRQILTGGIARAADGYLSAKFPLGSFADSRADGSSSATANRPAAAPAPAPSTVGSFADALKSPVVMVGGVAVLIVLVVMLARK